MSDEEQRAKAVLLDAMQELAAGLAAGSTDLFGGMYDKGHVTTVTQTDSRSWQDRAGAKTRRISGLGDDVGRHDQALMRTLSAGEVLEEHLVNIIDCWPVSTAPDGVFHIVFELADERWEPDHSVRAGRTGGLAHHRTGEPWTLHFSKVRDAADRQEELAWRHGLLEDPEAAFHQVLLAARGPSPDHEALLERARRVVALLTHQLRSAGNEVEKEHLIVCYGDDPDSERVIPFEGTYWAAHAEASRLHEAGVKYTEIYGPQGEWKAASPSEASPRWGNRVSGDSVTLTLELPAEGRTVPVCELYGRDVEEKTHLLFALTDKLFYSAARRFALTLRMLEMESDDR